MLIEMIVMACDTKLLQLSIQDFHSHLDKRKTFFFLFSDYPECGLLKLLNGNEAEKRIYDRFFSHSTIYRPMAIKVLI